MWHGITTGTRDACHMYIPTAAMSAINSLIILHILTGGAEFEISLDDLLDCGQEVLLRGDLATCSDREHASLSAHRPELSTGRVGAKSRDELPPNPALNAHGFGMDAEDVGPAIDIW